MLSTAQVGELRGVGEQLAGQQAGWRDRIPSQPEQTGFDFLWSTAFEDEEWERLRRRARSAFTALRGADNPGWGEYRIAMINTRHRDVDCRACERLWCSTTTSQLQSNACAGTVRPV